VEAEQFFAVHHSGNTLTGQEADNKNKRSELLVTVMRSERVGNSIVRTRAPPFIYLRALSVLPSLARIRAKQLYQSLLSHPFFQKQEEKEQAVSHQTDDSVQCDVHL